MTYEYLHAFYVSERDGSAFRAGSLIDLWGHLRLSEYGGTEKNLSSFWDPSDDRPAGTLHNMTNLSGLLLCGVR